ncbi:MULTISPECIES: Smr/MutS family protein [unclassified Flavobacterium]|uniref:Smr/MutS family protein n=1 Tax=unclassified Flavobacterium TaxID=196869 RepID=UPI0009592556|nr:MULTISPECIES: Smr/MutS family protein [unclassified Flavobacterium]MBN9282999.1 DNA mismatch repair protein MutS [Flavobacterium sp.]OJV67634.1 MAG: DNA mismatch repair protein MutS [Flavobacterium sp. 40-81]
MFNIGDQVAVLDDNISGVVVGFQKEQIIVETTDGFMMTYFVNELVKINNSSKLEVFNSGQTLDAVLKEKELPKKRSFVKEKRSKKDDFVLEIDLHIEKLVPSKRGMSNYDILTLQTETAKRQIEFAMRNRIPRIVFIHGVGEGILKAELDFLLGRYDNIVFQDADYQKYGLGATEVYFKQNANR